MAQPSVGQPGKAAAILDAEELARYRTVLGYLEEQMGLVERARAALAHADFLARSVDEARVRVWRELCEAHGLDPNAEYEVDDAGRVFRE